MRLNETLQQYQTKPLSVGQEAPTTVYSKEDMFQKQASELKKKQKKQELLQWQNINVQESTLNLQKCLWQIILITG
jgi:hypothetical protein